MKVNAADNIRLIREAKGFSQEFIAKKMKVTQQAYSAMEKQPDNMTLKRLKELCKILEVDLVTLLGEDNVFVQQNYNQKGGQAATQMVFNSSNENNIETYQSYILSLKEEIAQYRKTQDKLLGSKK